MMVATARELTPITSRDTLAKIINAIAAIDYETFSKKSHGDSVADLSSNTQFDSIEASPEAVFLGPDGTFEASAIVYVTLNYGGKRDAVSMPDSYPAIIDGKILGKAVSIEGIRVDTSSFYE